VQKIARRPHYIKMRDSFLRYTCLVLSLVQASSACRALSRGPEQFSDFYVMQQLTLIDDVQRKRDETCRRWLYLCRGEDARTSCKFLALVSPEAGDSCMFLIDKHNAHRLPHSFLSRFVPLISLTQEGDSCWWLAAVMCELLYQKTSLPQKQLSTQILV
jgi:hypothetical protein